MGGLLWQALIVTIPHRHEALCRLLASLDAQARPGFGVLLYRDNLQLGISAKRQALLEASDAEYVSFIDDDDEVLPPFTWRVLSELGARPDYVGFRVECREDGERVIRADHSIRHSGWHSWPDRLVRDISHLNPLQREIAVQARFSGENGEDARWADGIRATGLVREEAWIPEVLYRYQFRSDDCHRTRRRPVRPVSIRPLPSYPWLRVLDAEGSC